MKSKRTSNLSCLMPVPPVLGGPQRSTNLSACKRSRDQETIKSWKRSRWRSWTLFRNAREQEIKIKKLSKAERDQNGNHEHYLELQESKMKIMIIVERSSPSSLQQSSLASRSAAAWPRRTLPWTEGPSPCPSCRCPSSEGPGSGLWEFLLNQTIM